MQATLEISLRDSEQFAELIDALKQVIIQMESQQFLYSTHDSYRNLKRALKDLGVDIDATP